MPQKLRIGLAQVYTKDTLQATLDDLRDTTLRAASKNIDILLFPEAYLGGYPRTCNFGAAIGARSEFGREQFLSYFQSGVDLGDTPAGGGDDWIERRQPLNKETGRRGDGTREFLEEVAKETGVFIVTGVVEKSGGSLYCSALYIDPKRGVLGKRRKVMPTGTERLVWAQGQPSSLKAVSANIKGVKVVMGAVICWENYMPLLRYSMYAQGVNLWLAPTADARDTWEALMKTIACEGRCFVLSANQCVRFKNLPEWATSSSESSSVTKQQPPTPPAPSSPTPLVPSRLRKRSETPQLNGTSGSMTDRRKSMSCRTEENHEIFWKCAADKSSDSATVPAPDENEEQSPKSRKNDTSQTNGNSEHYPMGRRQSMSCRTEENNEIIWKCNNDAVTESAIAEVPEEHQQSSKKELPSQETSNSEPRKEVKTDPKSAGDEFASRGGSCIVNPMGKTLTGPIWEKESEIIHMDVDFDDCDRGRLDFDAAGHYSRSDAFKLTVEGLELCPPP